MSKNTKTNRKSFESLKVVALNEIESDVEETFGESPLNEQLWAKINAAINPIVEEAQIVAAEAEMEIKKRTDAYVARALIIKAIHEAETTLGNPLYELKNQRDNLLKELNTSVRVAGGIKVGKAPVQSPVRSKMEELDRLIARAHNTICKVIGDEFNISADEAYALVREEAKMYDSQQKQYEQKTTSSK